MRPRCPPLFALLAASCLAACNLPDTLGDLGGSLLNPDAELLETPGRRLATGHYSRLELDGSLESGGSVIARRHDLEEPSVSIVSFLGDKQCEVSGATEFQRVSSRIDIGLPGLIAFRREAAADGPRLVEFAGFDCRARLEPVDAQAMPTVPFPRSAPQGLLLLGRDGRLLLVDAALQRLAEVAGNVRAGHSEGDRLWLLEGDGADLDLVVYDADLRKVATWPRVQEIIVLPTGFHADAVVRGPDGLAFVEIATGDRELIDPDGCSPIPMSSQVLAYFAPCGERFLRLSVPGQLVGREEDRATIDIDSQVAAPGELITFWQRKDSYVIYQVSPNGSAATGEIRIAERLGYDAEEREEAVRSLVQDGRLHRSHVYTDWDGTSGTLMTIRLRSRDGISVFEGLEPVATKVAQLPGIDKMSERGVLVEYDGRVGDLVRLSRAADGYASEPLASAVPIQTQAVEASTGAFAFVGDLGSEGGNVYLVTRGVPRVVGERALPGTLRFLEQPRALAYLAHDGSDTTSQLRAWLIEAELNVRVSDRVSEYRELPWPSAGLLYSVPVGDRAGIWFARAR